MILWVLFISSAFVFLNPSRKKNTSNCCCHGFCVSFLKVPFFLFWGLGLVGCFPNHFLVGSLGGIFFNNGVEEVKPPSEAVGPELFSGSVWELEKPKADG